MIVLSKCSITKFLECARMVYFFIMNFFLTCNAQAHMGMVALIKREPPRDKQKGWTDLNFNSKL